MKKTETEFKVVINGPPVSEKAMQLLARSCTVHCTEPYLEPSELAAIMRQEKPHGLLVRMGKIDREVISASPNLRVISKNGSGVDTIDVKSAADLKIPVLMAPAANYESVAEHTLGMMLALAKDIPWLDGRMREGHWDKPTYKGVELYKKTIGLIGFGRIGRRVRELVAPLQMNVFVYDPFLRAQGIPADIMRVDNLETLLKAVDIVSIHTPLTEQTRGLIGRKELQLMKKTAWLINTAQREIVDQQTLAAALQNNEIGAARLDTFSKEPPEDIPLLARAGKVVFTPHIAGSTKESLVRMAVTAAENILNILSGKAPNPNC